MANPTDPFAQQKFEDELRFLSHDYYIRRAIEQVPPLNVIDFNGVFSDRAIALIGLQQITGQRRIGNRDYRMFASAPAAPPERTSPGQPSVSDVVASAQAGDLGLAQLVERYAFGLARGVDPAAELRQAIETLTNNELLTGYTIADLPRVPGLSDAQQAALEGRLFEAERQYRQRIGVLGPNLEDVGFGAARDAGLAGYYAKPIVGGFVDVPVGLAIEDTFTGVINAGITGLVDAPLPFPGGIPGGAVIGGILFPNGEPGTQFPTPPLRPPTNPGTPGAPPGGIPGIPDGLFNANPADP